MAEICLTRRFAPSVDYVSQSSARRNQRRVEALDERRGPGMHRNEEGDGSGDPGLLARRDWPGRGFKVRPHLNFDERDRASRAYDEIDFPRRNAIAARDDPIAFRPEEECRERLGPAAESSTHAAAVRRPVQPSPARASARA